MTAPATQPELVPDKPCEWCGQAPAAGRVIATWACASCLVAGVRERVRRALARWRRGVEGR